MEPPIYWLTYALSRLLLVAGLVAVWFELLGVVNKQPGSWVVLIGGLCMIGVSCCLFLLRQIAQHTWQLKQAQDLRDLADKARADMKREQRESEIQNGKV